MPGVARDAELLDQDRLRSAANRRAQGRAVRPQLAQRQIALEPDPRIQNDAECDLERKSGGEEAIPQAVSKLVDEGRNRQCGGGVELEQIVRGGAFAAAGDEGPDQARE